MEVVMMPRFLDGSRQKRRTLFRFFCGASLAIFATVAMAASEAEWNECVSGDHDLRIATCTKILRDDPRGPGDRALAYLARGDAYLAKQQYDKVISDLDEALKLGLHEAGVYARRGSARGAKGQHDLAIADFNEAIRLDSQFARAHLDRGRSHQLRGDNEQAINDYSEAIRLGAVGANVYNFRGMAYGEKRDYDRAIADYNEAIRLDNKLSSAHGSRGLALIAKGEYDQAIVDLNESIKLNPNFAGSYELRALAYVFKEDYKAAIADYSEAIARDPNIHRNYLRRGRAYLHTDLISKARDDFRQAAVLNPKDVYAVLWLDIANRRANSPIELDDRRSDFSLKDWSGRLFHFFLGEITQADLFAAAAAAEPEKKGVQHCDAYFYGGMRKLLTGSKEQAEDLFRSAANDCPRNIVESQEANIQLKKLRASR
jgi:lipoprotein NlpI